MKTKPFGFFALGAAIATLGLLPIKFPPKNSLKSLPGGFQVYEKEGFVVGYDSRNKVPLWIYEELSGIREGTRFLEKLRGFTKTFKFQ